MRKPSIAKPVYCALFAVMANSALAETIDVSFSTVVNYGQNLPLYGLSPSPGDPVSVHFTYDRSAPDTDPAAASGRYITGSAQITLGGHVISVSGPTTAYVEDFNGPHDLFGILGGTGWTAGPMLVDGVPTDGAFQISFIQPTGGLVGDGLPSLADWAILEPSSLYFSGPQGGPGPLQVVWFEEGNVTLRVSEISRPLAPVPEPSSWAMMGVGLLTLFGRARRRRL